MFTIIIFVFGITIFVYSISNSLTYSEEKLMTISKSIRGNLPRPIGFPIMKINSRNDFKEVWQIITDNVFNCDRTRDVMGVNQWAMYAVMYYTKDVLNYGSSADKRVLRNFVRLLERNSFI